MTSLAAFLSPLGLNKYESMFADEDVTVDMLKEGVRDGSITRDDLKEIGVTSFGHRQKIIKACQPTEVEQATTAVQGKVKENVQDVEVVPVLDVPVKVPVPKYLKSAFKSVPVMQPKPKLGQQDINMHEDPDKDTAAAKGGDQGPGGDVQMKKAASTLGEYRAEVEALEKQRAGETPEQICLVTLKTKLDEATKLETDAAKKKDYAAATEHSKVVEQKAAQFQAAEASRERQKLLLAEMQQSMDSYEKERKFIFFPTLSWPTLFRAIDRYTYYVL